MENVLYCFCESFCREMTVQNVTRLGLGKPQLKIIFQLRKGAREEQMSKRRNLTGDINKSPLKEKSPLREIFKKDLPKDKLNLDQCSEVNCYQFVLVS